jgi:hypothetical protein
VGACSVRTGAEWAFSSRTSRADVEPRSPRYRCCRPSPRPRPHVSGPDRCSRRQGEESQWLGATAHKTASVPPTAKTHVPNVTHPAVPSPIYADPTTQPMPNPMAPAAIGSQGRQNRPPSQSTSLTLRGHRPTVYGSGGGCTCTIRGFAMSRLGTKRVSSPPAPLAAPRTEGRRWFCQPSRSRRRSPVRSARFRSTGDAWLMEKATPAWMAAERASNKDLRPDESMYVRRPASMARDAGSFSSASLTRAVNHCVSLTSSSPSTAMTASRSPELRRAATPMAEARDRLACHPPARPTTARGASEQMVNSTSRAFVTRRGAGPRCQ